MLGLSTAITKATSLGLQYIKDGLKLYMPYRGSDASEVKFVGTGSTSFDGVNDYIDCGDPIITGTGDYTFCAWIKKGTDTGTARTVAGNYAGGAGLQGIQFSISASEKFYTYTDGTNDYVTGATDIPLNTWTHVASTRSSNNAVVYVNGVSDATGTLDNDIVGGLDFTIGSNPGVGEVYTGNIKNVAIWNRALTATEVQNVMYKTYAEVSGRLTDGLVSWWALDADSLGSNLVNNGGFDTNYDGWSGDSDGNLTWYADEGGILGIDNGGGDNTYAVKQSMLTGGKTYRVTFRYKPNNTGFFRVRSTAQLWIETVTAGMVDVWQSVDIYINPNVTGFTEFGSSGGNITQFYFDDVVIKEVQVEDLKGSNDGSIIGATVDEDLYGGDTPVKPRAIDNARTVQADAIGAGSAYFDGSNAVVSTTVPSSTFYVDFSCAFWVKRTVVGSAQMLVDNTGGADDGWRWYFRSGNDLRLKLDDGTLTTSTTFSINRWYHLAIVQNDTANTQQIYVDGVLDTSGTLDKGIDNENDVLLFGLNRDDGNDMTGNICQVGIWNATLTQAQIQSIMEKTYEELTASEKTNLVSYWALDETTLGSELITNGDMEANSTWDNTGSPTTQEQSSADKYSGTYSWHVAGADSNDGISSQTDGTGDFTTVTAVIYKINFWYKVVSGSFDISWQPGDNGVVINNITSASYSTTSWTEVSYNYTETAGGSQADIRFMSDTSGAEFYLDDVSIKEIQVEDKQGSNNGTLL